MALQLQNQNDRLFLFVYIDNSLSFSFFEKQQQFNALISSFTSSSEIHCIHFHSHVVSACYSFWLLKPPNLNFALIRKTL
ncbi:hypothetical protein L6164_035700 [Bauhinia variegata]|uniref:Uncharacterized protein n=1 Tax=Bauhinia variegata TaxID=167791 RepID=A0ACB9KER3_BAUVA|nr:hypothetical protein L6164_035700 [Bauhinia variegata]